MRTLILSAMLTAGSVYIAKAGDNDYLKQCLQQQVTALNVYTAQFSFVEHENKTYHSPRPWMVHSYTKRGMIWSAANAFAKQDTITVRNKDYMSYEEYDGKILLAQPYGRKNIVSVNESQVKDELVEVAKYNPSMLLAFMAEQDIEPDFSVARYARYTITINKAIISVYILKDDPVVEKITITSSNEMYGDVTNVIRYDNFSRYKKYRYHKTVYYTKLNGITDTVDLSLEKLVAAPPQLLEKPADYKISKDEPEEYKAITKKLSGHLYAVHLVQANSIAMLVEFKDFFVVLDVPLNSTNGELVQAEAKKIAPGKPIRYYAFGHHHPWYVGGIRPFIHNGTTILSLKDDIPYISFLAKVPHTMQPDSLELRHRQLKTEVFEEERTITDGEYEMQIYHIGELSGHTEDYLLFYFPQDKLLFEGDLLWIPAKGPVRAAGEREKGVYTAIQQHNMDVKTIVQGFPWGDDVRVKNIIPFTDLEAAMHVKGE